jgi:O-antigen/teichoic acid export membrane protein
MLFYFYASLLRTGTFEGGSRAYIDFKAKGANDEAVLVRDIAITVETVASILPGIAMAAVAFLLPDPTRRLGFLLAPAAVVLSSYSSYLGGIFFADERFDEIARVNLVRAVATPGLTLLGVSWWGAPAVFVAPMIVDGTAIAVLTSRSPRLRVRPRFDMPRWKPLLRTGFPLGAVAVVYWAYRLVGSTSIALAGTASDFGIYAFALAPVTALVAAIAAVHGVLTPSVWSAMAEHTDDTRWLREGERITLALATVCGFAANALQAAFLPVVLLALPKFRAATPLLEVLSFHVLLLSVAVVPTLVLSSVRVNLQSRLLVIWLGALSVNAAANAVVLAAGWGSMAVAVNDIWIQLAMVAITFWIAWPQMRVSPSWARTVRHVAAVSAFCCLVAAVLHLMTWAHAGSGLIPLGLARAGVVVVAWGGLVAWGRRRFLQAPATASAS